jgi:hypothetical protein
MKALPALVTLAVGFVAVNACTIEQQSYQGTCASIADCPLDQACDVQAKRCVLEPTSGFIGRFRCRLTAPNGSTLASDTAEVVGSVNGRRSSFTTVGKCELDAQNNTLTFEIDAYGTRTGTGLVVVVPPNAASAGKVQLGVADRPFGLNAATLYEGSTKLALGYSSKGTLLVANRIAVGSTVDVYIQVDMYPTVKADAVLGVPCPHGMADCGTRIENEAGFACRTWGSNPVCVRDCQTDCDCAPGGAHCVSVPSGNLCFHTCASNGDCPSPLTCGVVTGTTTACF